MFTKKHSITLAEILIFFAAIVFPLQKASAVDSRTINTTRSTSIRPLSSSVRLGPVERGHTIHRASTAIATLHVYTKLTDLKADPLVRHLLRSAVSADSPDSNPEVDDRTAATLNLDINETLVASLIRKDKFDLDQLESFEESNVVLGSLTRDNIFHLESGNALFAPERAITVLTNLGKIHIAANSLVGILKPSTDIVSIYDLEDGGNKKVTVTVGEKEIALSPGKHLVLSKEQADFEKINPAHRIAYRNLAHKTLPCGIHAYTTEFSISSAILHIKPLQNILLSEKKEDKKLADRLLKSFVVLGDIYSSAEPYKMPATMVPPVKISSSINP